MTRPFSDQQLTIHSDTCTLTSERPQANNSRHPGDDSESAHVDEQMAHHNWRALCSQLLSVDEEAVSDVDLLTLLLSYLDPALDARKLAMQLLSRFETFGNVVTARHTQISAVAKIEPKVVGFFRLVRAAGTRLAREEISHRPVIDAWAKLLTYLRATMAHQTVEQFRVLFLDRSNTLIADEIQHRGTIDHAPVYPREVVKRALELDASAIIMVHNHPSNKPNPSKSDIEMTRLVRDAVEKLGIILHDHIIIARRGHSSFRAMGLLGTKAA
jgi:DNA repair protein RadC